MLRGRLSNGSGNVVISPGTAAAPGANINDARSAERHADIPLTIFRARMLRLPEIGIDTR
jgi:hypothetical protein